MNVASSVAGRWLPGQPAENGGDSSSLEAAPDVERGLGNCRSTTETELPHADPVGSSLGSGRAAGVQGAAPDAHALLLRARALALEMVSALQHASRGRGYEESLLLPDSSDDNEAFTDRHASCSHHAAGIRTPCLYRVLANLFCGTINALPLQMSSWQDSSA